MTKRLILSIFLVLLPSFGWGATLYMGAGEAYTTLQAAMANMSAGDTLIIRDGTYTGAANQITNAAHPPTSSTVWTTIKAENDGAVLFDGETSRAMFAASFGSLTQANWQFEGLMWARSNASVVSLNRISHAKFLRCGGYDAGDGNTNVFFAGCCSYILFDGCFAYGSGRTSFTAWSSDTDNSYIIFRNLVSRMDRVTAPGEPIYNFGMYSVQHGLVQNCIAIDSDQVASYNNVGGDWSGGIDVPSTDRNANDVRVYNSIVLNSKIGGIFTTKNTYSAIDTVFSNVVVAGVDNKSGASLNQFRGDNNTVDHVTFVNTGASSAAYGLNAWPWTGNPNGGINMTNSIVTGYTGLTGGLSYGIAGDYNAWYGNQSPTSLDGTSIGSHSLTSVNPIWNTSANATGALKYITRIESGSNLSGEGAIGDIGANLTTLRGATGALWGETGYDTDTGVSMWPFPNESLIKAKMGAYTGGGVNGARGFCSSGQTLTKYVWEYLGNTIPSDIYGNDPETITCYQDADNDGYGHGVSETVETCSSGYYLASHFTALTGDANDNDASVYPGSTPVTGGLMIRAGATVIRSGSTPITVQ